MLYRPLVFCAAVALHLIGSAVSAQPVISIGADGGMYEGHPQPVRSADLQSVTFVDDWQPYAGVSVGVAQRTGPVVLSLRGLGLMYRKGPSIGFGYTSSTEGVEKKPCVNSRTRHHVSSRLCDGEFLPGLALEAEARLPIMEGLSVGGGYRIGAINSPYAIVDYVLGFTPDQRVGVRLQAAPERIGLGATVQIGRRD